MISDSTEKPERKPGRARKSGGLLGEGATKKEPTPPPLFVHKRRRDGEIQQLKRDGDSQSLKRDDEAALPASGVAVANSTSNNATPAPQAPEQLSLGL